MSSSRRVPATIAEIPKRRRRLKKGLRNRAGKGARRPPARHCNRGLVSRVNWNAVASGARTVAHRGRTVAPNRWRPNGRPPRWATASAGNSERQWRPRGSVDATRSRADGRNAEHAHRHRMISAPSRAISSKAICPALSKGAGLVLPVCNTDAMTLHLAEIARTVAPGAHAAQLMDQAGWHMTGALVIPDTISVLPLPARCPELDPVENIRQFMRDNRLSNRIFDSHDEILDHCCDAWNKLIAQPDRIASIGGRAMGTRVLISAGWY